MTVVRSRPLVLTPIGPDDVDDLLGLFNEPEVGRYLLDGEPVDREWVAVEVEASDRRFRGASCGLWAIRRVERHAPREPTSALIGVVGYRPFFDPPELQLLYALHAGAWGRGLAREAAEAAVGHAFEALDFDEVRAATDEPNTASIAVLDHLGMERWKTEAGEPWATFFYRLSRESWTRGVTSLRPREAPPP